jgi:hypothetical protein
MARSPCEYSIRKACAPAVGTLIGWWWASPDRLSRKPSTRGRQVDHSVTTRCSHARLTLTRCHGQRAGPMWTARHLLTYTRKLVDHAAFTRGPRGMHWLTAQRLLVIMRYSLVDNEWTPCAEAVQGGCRVALISFWNTLCYLLIFFVNLLFSIKI